MENKKGKNKKNNRQSTRPTGLGNVLRKIKYSESHKVQSLGIGTTGLNIDYDMSVDTSQLQGGYSYLALSQVGLTEEFQRMLQNYNYYKLQLVYILIYPNDAMNNIPLYLAMEWGETELDGQKIKKFENAKIIYNDKKNSQGYSFKPPNLQVEFNSRIYTCNAWVGRPTNVGLPFIPGLISIQQDEKEGVDNSIRLKLILRFLFRNPRPPEASSKFRLSFKGKEKEKEEEKKEKEKEKEEDEKFEEL